MFSVENVVNASLITNAQLNGMNVAISNATHANKEVFPGSR